MSNFKSLFCNIWSFDILYSLADPYVSIPYFILEWIHAKYMARAKCDVTTLSAGAVMTKLRSCISVGLTYEGLTLYALIFSEGTKTYICILCHIDMTQTVQILPQVRQELAYSMQSISWVLMSWQLKEPGHRQPRYLLYWTKLTRSPHIKGWVLTGFYGLTTK